MGVYINPKDETKEEFLSHYPVVDRPTREAFDEALEAGDFYVCLVNNVAFTAAAIAYKYSEVECFADSMDIQPRLWFLVPEVALRLVSNLGDYIGP